jgi:hypothetical protein
MSKVYSPTILSTSGKFSGFNRPVVGVDAFEIEIEVDGLGALGAREPLIKVLSRSEDLIDMLLRPKTQPLHLVYQRAS